MKLKQLLEKFTELKTEIGELDKLPKKVLQKINYKFRLDWNYYSNRMEGGTLTREETRSVMVGNITVAGKPIKDVLEMNGHDTIVRELLKIGKGEIRISEKRIQSIHKAIMAPGDDDSVNKQIGVWKENPNEIINYKGEKISFTPPSEVPEKIHSLLNTTNAQLDAFFNPKKQSLHPLVIASNFHIGFVSIHPFFDGNGRSARILMNLILISCGYPPIIINDTTKKAYYQYLADIQGYGGDKELFYSAMGELLLHSLQLVKNAIDGKSIDDEDDLYKRLDLLNRINEQEEDYGVQILLDNLDKQSFINTNLLPLTRAVYQTYNSIMGLFADNKITLTINTLSLKLNASSQIENALTNLYQESKISKLKEFQIGVDHEQYKKAGTQAFDASWELRIVFEKTRFMVFVNKDTDALVTKLYHQIFTEQEIKTIHKNYLKTILDSIDQHLDKLNHA